MAVNNVGDDIWNTRTLVVKMSKIEKMSEVRFDYRPTSPPVQQLTNLATQIRATCG